MEIIFSKSQGNKFQVYHSQDGENQIKWLTRMDIFFILGNGSLLALELMSPFFGYWHAVSEALIVIFSMTGARFLHYYSTRMVHNLYLLPDGKQIEVEYFSAFGKPKKERMRIINFGYMEESRFLNLKKVSY